MKKKLRAKRSSQSGFTLFEMVVVLTIIAMLAGFVIFNLANVPELGKTTTATADINTLRTNLALYKLNTGHYPTTEQGLDALVNRPTKDPVPARWTQVLTTPAIDPWDHPYQYRYPGKHNPSSFDVFTMGPDGLPDTADDIGNWPSDTSNKQQQ